jgi:P-aminobenzoate N-oxygenase AurF
MADLTVRTQVEARLDWAYDSRAPRLRNLYEKAKQAQWNASNDVDWSVEVPFGAALPEDSAYGMASFAASPLAKYGRSMWDTFRWELQSWMVSQFLHGEQGALVVAARLVEMVPTVESKCYAASQTADEARHVEVFSRYLREKVPAMYPVAPPLGALITDILTEQRWDVTALGMQIMVEALAMAAFRLADSTFHDDLIKQIARLVARDEARHVSFGVLSLEGVYREMTRAELADREEMVLEAAYLTRQRFLLEDVWARLGVPAHAGMEYARTDPLMVRYRRTVFAKVVTVLRDIGLLTGRVRDGLVRLDLA